MTSDLGHGCQPARGSFTGGKCSAHITVELARTVSSTDNVRFFLFFFYTSLTVREVGLLTCINCVKICDLYQSAAEISSFLNCILKDMCHVGVSAVYIHSRPFK